MNLNRDTAAGLITATIIGVVAAEPVKHLFSRAFDYIDARLLAERVLYVDFPSWYDGDPSNVRVDVIPLSDEPDFSSGESFRSRHAPVYFSDQIPDRPFKVVASITTSFGSLIYVSSSDTFLSADFPVSHSLPERDVWILAYLTEATATLEGQPAEDFIASGSPWMAIAEAELNFWAQEGNTERSVTGQRRIQEYFSATGFHTVTVQPWACAFVSWVVAEALGDVANTSETVNGARCSSWENIGEPLSEPAVGAIAILSPPVGSASSGFAGFITDIQDDTLSILGGNVDDTVQIRRYELSRVTGVRWPMLVD